MANEKRESEKKVEKATTVKSEKKSSKSQIRYHDRNVLFSNDTKKYI